MSLQGCHGSGKTQRILNSRLCGNHALEKGFTADSLLSFTIQVPGNSLYATGMPFCFRALNIMSAWFGGTI